MLEKKTLNGFNVFTVSDEVHFNRLGTKVYAKGRDGKFVDSESVEANLLFEILKALRKK